MKSNAKSLGQGNTPCCQPATSQPRCCPKSTIQKHVISFAQASCSPTPSSSLRMGSLPKDTLCAYCGKRRAEYITDACIGPPYAFQQIKMRRTTAKVAMSSENAWVGTRQANPNNTAHTYNAKSNIQIKTMHAS